MNRDLDKRIEDLKKQLKDLQEVRLPNFKKGGHYTYVDHEDATAEKRHIEYLVMLGQIENLKEAIKELETIKSKSLKEPR